MSAARFTYYGRTEDQNRDVKFYRRGDGMYVCEIESMPTLRIAHPSKKRVMAAFKGWWEMALKADGASEIDWGDMATNAEQEESLFSQLKW